MKNIFLILLCLSVFTSCKNETKQNETTTVDTDGVDRSQSKDGLTTLSGEFIYYADAAVLQSGNSVYGVILNEKMQELNTMGKPFRAEATDGIQVQIRAKVIPQQEGVEGWPFNLDIKEIINVKKLDPKQNEVVKIGK